MKYLLLALLVVAVIWLIKNKAKASAAQPTSRPERGREADGEEMLRCAQCGTYTPASDAIVLPSGKAFCSEEHRVRHAARDSGA